MKLSQSKGMEAIALQHQMCKVYFSDAMERINIHGKHAIAAFSEGDEQRMMLMGLKRFTKYEVVNTKAVRRMVAEKMIEANGYAL
jgi:hypothetical protein